MADTAQELTSGIAAPPPPPPSCTLPFIFYPILGRKRFGEATIPRPPSVLQPAIGALRVCLRFRKPPKFVTIYQNASGEISTRHWASHNDHAHRCLRNMLKGRTGAKPGRTDPRVVGSVQERQVAHADREIQQQLEAKSPAVGGGAFGNRVEVSKTTISRPAAGTGSATC